VDKELVARLIHDASEWTTGPFLTLEASVIPGSLLGRELFGCDVGAIPTLPGAYPGALASAAGGTVLLETLEAFPKDLQQALALVLERGRFRRLGGRDELPLDCRLIATSLLRLAEVTGDTRMIPELSERFRLLEVQIPPLQERPEDIVPISAQALWLARAELEHETGRECPARGFSRASLDRLVRYPWPGNERELRARVTAALRMSRGTDIEAEDLMLDWSSADSVPPFRDAKRSFEREYVIRVLRLCHGNISRAARIAKKDRKDFYDVMRRNAISPIEYRA
jgi:two-component system response regulator GlrR